MKKYDHKKIEKKHQQNWEKDGAYNTKEDKNKQKYYCLVEFPYASGEGLHVGHVRGYTALDIIARKKRMEGFNVLYPIGLDAFGLPTENYAIKTGINPKIIIRDIANTFRRQLKSLGFSFDWSREINTSDPEYYKWTQWIFLQFFKHGFAYKKKMPINWCVDCKIGLANEEVINGVCERCGGQVEKKEKEQWMLAITKYADRLYDDLDKTEFLEKIKVQQRNWIGRSSGVLISFALATTQIGADKKPQINADGKIVLITNVQEFRENVNIDSKLKIEGREFSIKELIKFKLDDGSFYLKLFLSGGYVLADDLNSNSFILVKEKDTNLKIEEDDITFENKKYSFSYKAHAIAEEVFGEEIFKKGESETFWDYTSGNNYLSLGIVDKNKKRLDFLGKTIKADKIEVTNLRESASNLRSSATFTKVNVFTTRPDTLFGATYLVLAPEHELIRKMLDDRSIENKKEVEKYISETAKKKDIDRMAENKIKTGVELKGIKAINPAYRQAGPLNKKEIPVFIADYVLDSYGTGAIMAVPAHDERDYAFASQINADNKTQMGADNKTSADRIEIIKVIESDQNLYTGYGKLINSGKFNGMESEKAMKEITKFVGGELKTIYSLRDWIFSRQRYWGEPIPLVFCNECKKRVGNSKFQIPNSKKIPNSKLQIQNQEFNKGELLNPGWVIDEKLPFELPDVKKYEPTDTGESPLASVKKWVNVKCPKCGADAKRETDTMPNWAGSSWYWLRYIDSKNDKEFASMDKLKYWTPVDWYNGGMEHTTLHLLYSRFWHKFLFDIGLVPTDEPYIKRTSHGMILGEGGEKMSKSKGNVINPDDIIEKFGADSFRLYEMFMGPFDQHTSWNTNGVVGMIRFIEKVYGLLEKLTNNESEDVDNFLNKTIKKVEEDIENMKFNTAISSMMVFVNFVYNKNKISKNNYKKFLKILSPFAPHVTEELWLETGEKESIHKTKWPEYDKIKEDKNLTIVVQVNGKIRDKFIIDSNLDESQIKDKALSSGIVLRWIGDKEIKKTIYVRGKLINIVTI